MSTEALQAEVLLRLLRSLGHLWSRTLFFHRDEESRVLYEFIGVGQTLPYLCRTQRTRDASERSASIPGACSPLSCERCVRSGENKSELVRTQKRSEPHRLISIIDTKVTDVLLHSRFCFVNTCMLHIN